MDPTTGAPSSPLPPPQNPRTATDANSDSSTFDRYQKGTSRNMDNFRLFILKLSGRLSPAHQSLIERRLDDFFPDELLVPDHPPYADMILTALWELNAEGGSSEEAISNFIVKEYHELPWAHATILNRHLRDLCMKGEIAMTHDRCYLRRSSITQPVPRSSPSPCLDDGLCSSPISSSSTSFCSSASSSSSSLCWGPYERQKRPLKRKRKRKRNDIRGRGRKTVQVRRRGRPPKVIRVMGRGRQPTMIQVEPRGRSRGMTQARRQSKLTKDVKIGEISRGEEEHVDVINVGNLVVADRNNLEEPKQVTEDQYEVKGMDIEEDAIQDGDHDVTVSIRQQVQEDGAEKYQYQTRKRKNALAETGFSVEDRTKAIGQKVGEESNGHVKEEQGSVELRRSGRRQNDVSEQEILPCEQHKVGAKEQYRPRKQYNVTWIGRGEHIQEKGECVEQRRSGNKQQVSKEQHKPCELLEEGIKKQGHERKQYNVVWIGRGVRKLEEAGRDLLKEQSDDKVLEPEDDVSEEEGAVMTSRDAEVDGHVEGLKQKEAKGATGVGSNRSEKNQQYALVEKQALGKEQLMSVKRDKILACERHERVGMETEIEVAEILQFKQPLGNVLPETFHVDDIVMEDQCFFMARSEAQEDVVLKEWSGKQEQVEGASMEQIGSHLQQNDLSGEQVDLRKQIKGETDDEFHTQGQQQRGNMEQDQLQKQEVEMADEQNSVMMQCEAQVTVAGVEKQHDGIVEEQIRPEEQPKVGTKEEFQPHEQQKGGCTEQKMLEKQVEMVGKPLQNEEIQKERILTDEGDEERSEVMIRYEAQARVESVEKFEQEDQYDYLTVDQVEAKEHSKEPHGDVTEELIHPQEQCAEGTEEKPQSCGPDWLKNEEFKLAEEQPQQEEQQTEVNYKETGHVMDTEVQQDLLTGEGETEVRRAGVEQNESEGQQYVTEKHVQPQDYCMGGNEFQLHDQQQTDSVKQVQLEGREVEVAEDAHQQKQLNKVEKKDTGLMNEGSDGQQDSVMTLTEADVEGDNKEHNKSEVHQDQLEKQEAEISKVQPQHGQHNTVLKEKPELMNNLTELIEDLMIIQGESQLEGTRVEYNEVQEDDTIVVQLQPHELFTEGAKEGQKDENEAGLEKNQSEQCENGVTVQRDQPQEQCVEGIEERNQTHIEQIEMSEKYALQEKSNAGGNESLGSSGSIIEGSRDLTCESLGIEKICLPDHKHQGEQRRPLRQGLRSSSKKEEATPNAENKHARVTPVRRSLRPRRTISEAAALTKGLDRSKEQLKHSARARPSKRKPKVAEAGQASKSRKTRRTHL